MCHIANIYTHVIIDVPLLSGGVASQRCTGTVTWAEVWYEGARRPMYWDLAGDVLQSVLEMQAGIYEGWDRTQM